MSEAVIGGQAVAQPQQETLPLLPIRPEWIWIAIFAAFAGIFLLILSPGAVAKPPIGSRDGVVVTVDKAGKIAVQPASGDPFSVSAGTDGSLSELAPGDTVWFRTDEAKHVSWVQLKKADSSCMRSVGAMLLAFAVAWSIMLLITRGHPWAFALGLDRRLSNSQTQMYLWFVVLATIYLAELGLRAAATGYFAGIDAPPNLLALAGVSAATFGGARASTSSKTGMNPKGKPRPENGRSRWSQFQDLFTNDAGTMDLGDSQLIVFTAIAILAYLVVSAEFLRTLTFSAHIDLPPVEQTLIAGSAVSHGAYLFKKIASPLGN